MSGRRRSSGLENALRLAREREDRERESRERAERRMAEQRAEQARQPPNRVVFVNPDGSMLYGFKQTNIAENRPSRAVMIPIEQQDMRQTQNRVRDRIRQIGNRIRRNMS